MYKYIFLAFYYFKKVTYIYTVFKRCRKLHQKQLSLRVLHFFTTSLFTTFIHVRKYIKKYILTSKIEFV